MVRIELPIIWDDKYERMGVSPEELYMRQQGLCYLIVEKDAMGNKIIHCTDGKEKAPTASLLNPTFECSNCMVNFMSDLLYEKEK